MVKPEPAGGTLPGSQHGSSALSIPTCPVGVHLIIAETVQLASRASGGCLLGCICPCFTEKQTEAQHSHRTHPCCHDVEERGLSSSPCLFVFSFFSI